MNEQPVSFFRPFPKKVQQYKDEEHGYTCWAACLVSWLSVTPQSPGNWLAETQDDAIKNFGGQPFTDQNGILKGSSGLKWAFAATNMDFYVIQPGTALSGLFLYNLLRYKSHIYFYYHSQNPQTQTTTGHTIVIYGIKNPASDNCKISYMEPWIGDYKLDVPFMNFQAAEYICIGFLGHAGTTFNI